MGIITTENLNLYYGNNHALKNINMDIEENKVTALIGPSGCGKSTFLRTLNRTNNKKNGLYWENLYFRTQKTINFKKIIVKKLREEIYI